MNDPFCVNTAESKNLNKNAVLELIRYSQVGISRAEIARQLNLSRTAITILVGDLLNLGIIRETDSSPSTGGRRGILLDMNPKFGFLLGIDIGATHLGFVLADFSARVIKDVELPVSIAKGPRIVLEQVNTHLRELLADCDLALEQINAIGVGVPGPVDTISGTVSMPPIMPGWNNYPIRTSLETLWQRPVSLNNDAELGALGEWAFGAGRGECNLVYIKIGTGIGAGLLLDGNIYRGASGCAGEIGHITIDSNGPSCTCGNRGCLEAFAGGRAVVQMAVDAVRAGKRTSLASIRPIEGLTAMQVAAAARRGDLVAQQVVAEAGFHLGTAIAALVNLFNPSIVVVGGGIAQTGDLLLEPIRRTVQQRSLRSAFKTARITASILGSRSTGMGAVAQALNLAIHQVIA